jgi:short-subunit dehydrogenase
MQGLRNRHHRAGLHVLTVKPGFVDTPMTAHVPRNALFADPRDVARSIVRAADARRDVVYVPWFWRWIMLVVRSIPEALFKRLEL